MPDGMVMPDGTIMETTAFYGPMVALLIFGIIIVLVVILVRWLHKMRMARLELNDGPLIQLKEQHAKGEITTREFEKRRRRL